MESLLLMCFYITSTLPKDTDIESIRPILNQYNMAYTPIKNNNLDKQLRPDELHFRATKDYCDCDSSLGFQNRDREYQELLNSKKVKTLRKKKWTEIEIDEWIKKKLKNKPPHTKRSITENERQLDVNRWIDFISEIINKKIVSRIGVLKHWYTHGLQNEEFNITKTVKLHLDELTSELLVNLAEDVLYVFLPRYHW
jgi:hypothetical protein